MTARTSYERRQLAAELSFRMRMTEARAQLAQDRATQREVAAAARFAALQPALIAAGYGPHGGADRIRAEARAVRSRAVRAAGIGDEHTGADCRICRPEAARRDEITR